MRMNILNTLAEEEVKSPCVLFNISVCIASISHRLRPFSTLLTYDNDRTRSLVPGPAVVLFPPVSSCSFGGEVENEAVFRVCMGTLIEKGSIIRARGLRASL